MKKAVVLVSGGLDSATTLYIAKSMGYECYALSFDYGQKHRAELNAAKLVVEKAKAAGHHIVDLDLRQFGGSALTDDHIKVPDNKDIAADEIPVTYVPARNTIFLSIALGYAEVLGASDIFIGVTAVDYSGYPDCRPEFIASFERMANLATKMSVEGQKIKIQTPLIDLSKAKIIERGTELDVPYADTVSCYNADDQGRACGTCDSCTHRTIGFQQAAVPDTTRYV